MKRYLMVILSLVVVFSMVLTACGKPTEEPTEVVQPTAVPTAETKPTTPPAGGVELKMWIMPNGSDPQGMIDAELAAFMELNPDIKVTAEVVGWGDAYGKIQTASQGGEGPCVSQFGTTWVPTFAAMGGLRFFTAEEVAAVGGAETFVKASWESSVFEGNVATIPWFADVRAIGYRKDILEQAGLTEAEAFKDLDSMVAAMGKIRDLNLTDAEGSPIAAFVHPGKNDWNVWQNASMWIWAFGGDLLTSDGSAAAFASSDSVDAMAMYTSLFANGLTPENTLELNSASAEGEFNGGRAAMVFAGPWEIANSRATGDAAWPAVVSENFSVAEMPAGPGGQYTFVGGSNLGIFKTCQYPDAAVKLVQYLAGKESQVRYSTAVSMLPASNDGQKDPYFADDPLFQVFISAAAKGKTPMPIAQWGAVENTLQTAIQGIWEEVAAAGVGTELGKDVIQTKLLEAATSVNDVLGAPAPTAEPPKTLEAAEFTMWIMPNGSDPQGMIDVEIAEFEKLHPEIKITAEVVGWGDAYGKIQTASQGGEGPCVSQLGTTWVPTFAAMGGLRFYTAEEVAAVGGAENFVNASWESSVFEGNVATIPWFADVRAIGYRKDILEQAGLTEAEAFKDVDSFVAAMGKIRDLNLTDAEGSPIAAFVHPGKNDWNVWQNASMWIWAFGGDLLTSDGSAAAFASSDSVDAMAMYTSLFANGLTPENTLELNSASAEGEFNGGRAAMIFAGPWEIANSRATGDAAWPAVVSENFGVAEMPAGPGGQYTFVGGSNLGIFNTCQYPDQAFEFVKFLAGKESQVRYSTAVSMLPASNDGQKDPYFADDPLFQVFISAAAKGKTPMPIAQWGAVENTLQTAIQSIWEDVAAAGLGTPITAEAIKAKLDEAAAAVNELLK